MNIHQLKLFSFYDGENPGLRSQETQLGFQIIQYLTVNSGKSHVPLNFKVLICKSRKLKDISKVFSNFEVQEFMKLLLTEFFKNSHITNVKNLFFFLFHRQS